MLTCDAPKVDPYKGCAFMTTKGMAIVVSSAETEPDGFGGYLVDLEVEFIRGGRHEKMVNLSSKVIEEALNRAEQDALQVYEEGLQRLHAKRTDLVVECPSCGPLAAVPHGDHYAAQAMLSSHNTLRHSDN